jgi:phosphoglycolate phosphatase
VSTLVLWDIDGTLLNAAGFGWDLVQAAFLQLHGRPVVEAVPLAGRTDRAIATDLLTRHGIEAAAHVDAFTAAVAGLAEETRAVVADEIARRGGGPIAGAAEAIAAVAQLPGVVQSVLSGNLAILGAVKLGGFRQFDPLDLSLAAFGDHHTIRAELVDVARHKYAERYGSEPEATVLIGDTPLDVEAAQLSGARVIAVATGRYGVEQLTAVGAPVVLADLLDVNALVAAVFA